MAGKQLNPRKPRYTPEIGELVCARIAKGESASKIGRDIGIPPRTITGWAADGVADFATKYARAQEERGEHYGQLVADIAQETLDGKWEPNAARVAIDAFKWTAARMKPKTYGDHSSKVVVLEAGAGFVKLLESLDDKPMVTIEATVVEDD